MRRTARLFGLALAAVVVPLTVQGDDGVRSALAWSEGVCSDPDGVTVVVDFQELGGGVNARCAPGPVDSGLDAFDRAGIAWEGTLRFPDFVCRIAGLPAPGDEACGNTPPASAYWSYWVAPRGGSWCYSSRGAAGRTPPPGTIEGWSFALDKSTAQIPPPRLDPPPRLPGVEPAPLNPGDCSAPIDPPATTTTTTTTSTSTTTTSTTPATTPAVAAATTAAPATTSPRPPVPAVTARPVVATTAPATTSAATAEPSKSTTTTVTSASTTAPSTSASASSTAPSTSSSTPASSAPVTISLPPTSAGDESDVVPLGTVDLGDDGRGGGPSAGGVALGTVAIAAVATSGIVMARRRRRLEVVVEP